MQAARAAEKAAQVAQQAEARRADGLKAGLEAQAAAARGKLAAAAATNTKLGWGYNVTDGKLRHMGVDLDWKGMRPARNNDRIKLVLDSDVGSLTLFLNGVRLGELVGDDSNTGLPDLTGRNLAWLVELDKQGDSVLIGSV